MKEHQEPDVEQLLLRIVPNLANEWAGYNAQEISALEQEAGVEFPLFYKWFLSKMGRSVGKLADGLESFTIPEVKKAIVHDDVEWRSESQLYIGHSPGEALPGWYAPIYYALDCPLGSDAEIFMASSNAIPLSTLREYVANRALELFHIFPFKHSNGLFKGNRNEVLVDLDAVMRDLGFVSPIKTGSNYGFYERADATLVTCGWKRSDAAEEFRYAIAGRGGDRDDVLIHSIRRAIGKNCRFVDEVFTPERQRGLR